MSGQQKKPQPKSTNRSVVHYDTEDALRKALLAVELNKNDDNNNNIGSGGGDSYNNNTATAPPVIPAEEESNDTAPLDDASSIHNNQNLDWVLTNYDAETTEVQSMKEELKRLQVLKSYAILDSEKEAAFDRITAIASRVFNVPISLVSLVDLGRQWFMSNHGLPADVRETPRKLAFCSHVILSKNNLLVIPDATKDIRFKDNALVTRYDISMGGLVILLLTSRYHRAVAMVRLKLRSHSLVPFPFPCLLFPLWMGWDCSSLSSSAFPFFLVC